MMSLWFTKPKGYTYTKLVSIDQELHEKNSLMSSRCSGAVRSDAGAHALKTLLGLI